MTQSVSQPQVFAEDARRKAAKDRRTKWPGPHDRDDRLLPICQPEHRPKFTIAFDSTFFTIGSCFARHIETHLSRLGIKNLALSDVYERAGKHWKTTPLNKYTPLGIRDEIFLSTGTDFDETPENYLVKCGDQYFDPYTRASGLADLETAVERRNIVRQIFSQVTEADVIIITLGQIEYWEDSQSGICFDNEIPQEVLNQHPGRFLARTASYDLCRQAMHDALRMIRATGPEKKIIISTSPVPAKRTFRETDALCGYLHAKSVLRALAQELADSDPLIDYFPSFEMIMLSDKTVVFDSDLIHVRDSMVSKVMSTFILGYIEKPADGSADTELELLHASNARAQGETQEAYDRLARLRETAPSNANVAIEFALAASRLNKSDEAFPALCDLGDDPGNQEDVRWHLTIAMEAAVDLRLLEATSRVLTIAEHFRSEIFGVESEELLATVLSIISKVLDGWVFRLITKQDLELLFDKDFSSAGDIECRRLCNEALNLNQRHDTTALSMVLDTLWTDHLSTLTALSSKDIRQAFVPMLKASGMSQRGIILEELDRTIYRVENATK